MGPTRIEKEVDRYFLSSVWVTKRVEDEILATFQTLEQELERLLPISNVFYGETLVTKRGGR